MAVGDFSPPKEIQKKSCRRQTKLTHYTDFVICLVCQNLHLVFGPIPRLYLELYYLWNDTKIVIIVSKLTELLGVTIKH